MASTKMNRAILYSEPPTIKTHVEELPIQKPGPGEVLVRLSYSGVCHTDYAFCTNAWKLPFQVQKGQIGGHEGIGEVIEQGPGVALPAVGAKVGIKYAADACLNCDNCLVGGETSCSSVKISGFFTPGTFQQYIVSPARYVTPIPDGVDLAAAAPLMCGGIAVYTGLKRANIKSGDWVLISGAGGGLGHLAIQYAKAMGARVLAVDAGSKKALCNELGAEAFIDFAKFSTDEELTAEVLKISTGGVRTVLMCSSNNRAYTQALGFLGFRGTLCCLGVPEGENPFGPKAMGPILNNEVTIIGVKAGNRQEAKECLDFAARGLVKAHYQLRSMENLTEVFEEMENGTINGRIVIDLR